MTGRTECQPGTESLPERLRVNSCRRGNETPDEAATRRVTTEFEAANHIESMEWGIASVAVALGWTELKGVSLEDHAATLQARVDELTKALEWQPIETAPKDGTPVLLGFPGHFHAMHGHYEDGFWGQLDSDFGFEHLPTQPTHWMPLPRSPVVPLERSGGAT